MEFSNRTVGLFLAVILMGLICTTSGYDFYVGGKDGWIRNPSESFNNWAGRMRFQVHDRLVFKYNKGEDSVLEVNKEGYDSCNVSVAIKKIDDDNSTFELDRSGAFYFISGANGSCAMGQKLIVVVMADRSKPVPTPPPPSTSPPPPSSQSPSPSSPSPSSGTPSLSPSASSVSPSSSPSSATPSPSPSPSSASPSASDSPSPSSASVSPPSSSTNTPLTPTASPGVSAAPGPTPSEDNQSSSSSDALTVPRLSVGALVLLLATAAVIN